MMEGIDDGPLRDALEDRAATYGLLARLFNREVDRPLLEELSKLPFASDTGLEAVDTGNRLMRSFLRESGRDEETILTELAVDFTRIFVIREAHLLTSAYPFESVYTSATHTIMSDARDHVLAWYRSAGLEKSDAWKTGEDHISLELEFEQFLVGRSIAALDAGDAGEVERLLREQLEFLNLHILNWVPRFAEALEANAQTDFYRGLAHLLIGYLEEDRRFLHDLLA